MTKRLTTEEYIAALSAEHKRLFNYSKVVYKTAKDKIEVVCNKHKTSFWQEAFFHKSGGGCPTCARESSGNTQRTTQNEFIESSLAAKGEDIDHSLVAYKNSTTKVDFICHKEGHGVFSMLPLNRLRGQQCPKCAAETKRVKNTKTQDQFLSECLAFNNPKLSFEKVYYVNDVSKVIITCSEHSDFKQTPSSFRQHGKCPKCAKHGFNDVRGGYVYILSDYVTTKVGITNRQPSLRAKEVLRSGGPKLDIIASFYFKEGSQARTLETACHKYLAQHYKPADTIFDGSTECFIGVDIPMLLSFVTPLATQHSES